MFNYFKKSFLIFLLILGILPSAYAMQYRQTTFLDRMGDTAKIVVVATFAANLAIHSIFVPYLYEKINQYNYTLQGAFSRILETGNFTQENLQVIQKYLEKGYSPNIRIGKNEKIPLILAVEHQNLDIIKLLLRYNADINMFDGYWGNPLSVAIKTGNLHIAKYLLEHNADPNSQNNIPLIVAVFNQNLDMVKLLLQYKVNINSDHYGDTPLSAAIDIYNFEAIKLLCNAGVSLININKRDNSTAFHAAISRAWGDISTLRENSKKYIEAFIIYTRFDDLPRIALETLLILKKQYPETYKDLHDLTLSKLLASNNIDNLDNFKKKMGQELTIMTTYKDPLLAQVYKRILRLKEILQMRNDQNQTALELLHIDFNAENYTDSPDDLQCIQEVELLLNGAKLDDDFNKLEAALKDINSESKIKLTSTELISELESKLDQNNLALQMYKNCAS